VVVLDLLRVEVQNLTEGDERRIVLVCALVYAAQQVPADGVVRVASDGILSVGPGAPELLVGERNFADCAKPDGSVGVKALAVFGRLPCPLEVMRGECCAAERLPRRGV
jgi:hypothetical protein